MLSVRHQEIIAILKRKGTWTKGKEIADEIGVTVRTIRSDIASMNEEIDDIIESNTRKGYRINNAEIKHIPMNNYKSMPQTPEERKFFILRNLLIVSNDISFYELQKLLFVSEYTIESDIRQIRKMTDSYEGLELVRSNNRIYFKGKESVKRQFYFDVLRDEIEDDFLHLNKIAELYHRFDLLKVTQCLESVLVDSKCVVRKTSIPIIAIQTGVSLDRMLNGCFIEPQADDDEVRLTYEFKVARKFFEEISEHIPIEYNDSEVAALARLLIVFNKSVSPLNDTVYVNNQFKSINVLIDHIFDYLEEMFGYNFKDDVELRNGLHLHIQSLCIRARNNVAIPNIYLEEIKESYPFVFEMSVHISRLISDYLDISITESETAFVALHLGAAHERNRQADKYKVLLISSGNYSFSKLAESKIKEKFKDKLDVVDTLSYFETSEVEKYNVDLIITFFPISHVLDIPTINISMFMNNQDEAKIFFAISDLEKRRYSLESKDKLTTIIEEELYHNLSGFSEPKKILRHMTDTLEEYNYVDEHFFDSVMRREELASTSFAQGIAVPHPLFLKSEKSVISVATLDKPVVWGDHEVELVLLLAINEEDTATFSLFFERLSMLLSDAEKMQELKSSRTRSDFIRVMTT